MMDRADPWVVRKAKSFFVLQENIYCIHIQSILLSVDFSKAEIWII